MKEEKMKSYDRYTYDKKRQIKKAIIKTTIVVVAVANLALASFSLYTSKNSAEKVENKKPAVELTQNEQVQFVAPTKLVMEQKNTDMEVIGHMQAMTDSVKDEVKNQSEKTSAEISSLKENVSSYASQVEENNAKIDELGKNVDALHSDVSSLGDNVSKIDNKVEEYQSSVDSKVAEAVKKIEENRKIELESKQAQEETQEVVAEEPTTPVEASVEIKEETQDVGELSDDTYSNGGFTFNFGDKNQENNETDLETSSVEIENPIDVEENVEVEQPTEETVEETTPVVEETAPEVSNEAKVAVDEKSKLASVTVGHFKRESSSTHAVDTGVSYKDNTLTAAALYNNIITTKENGKEVSSLGLYGGVAYSNGNLKTNSVDLTAGAMYKTKSDKGLVTSLGGQFTSSINPKAEISPTIEINAGLGNIKVGKNATLDINAGFMAGGSNSDNSPSGKVTGRISWGSNPSQLNDSVRLYEMNDKINSVIENATANNKKFAGKTNVTPTPTPDNPDPTPDNPDIPNPPTPDKGALTPSTDHPETPEFNF